MLKLLTSFQFTLGLVPLSVSLADAATVFRGATVATWDDAIQSIEVHRDVSILVEEDYISRIYPSNENITDQDVEVIDARDKIIVPGFISTHHHMWQTIYKTLRSNTSFADYVPRLSQFAPFSSTLTADEVYNSQLMGSLEMLSEGVTSWIDCTGALSDETVDAALRATIHSGGRGFFGAAVDNKETYPQDEQISHIREIVTYPELLDQSLVTVGLSYDAFETASPDTRDAILDLVATTNFTFITTHQVGGPWGMNNSPEILNSQLWNLLNGSLPIVFGHASYLSPLDASLLRQTDQYISTTPESELHFGHGNPAVHRIQDQASLGGDTQFPYSTSLITQARMWLQQLRGRLQQQQVENWIIPSNSPMSVNQALYLGTRAGALALRRPDLGIIAEGAKADLVVIDTTGPNLVGWRDPVAAVILHSNPGDISDVMVGGKFVKKDFKLTYESWSDLKADFESRAKDVGDRYAAFDFPADPPPFFTLGEAGRALEVDVVRGDATGY